MNEKTLEKLKILAIRLKIDEEKHHYFPYNLQNKSDRYIGVKFSLYGGLLGSSRKKTYGQRKFGS